MKEMIKLEDFVKDIERNPDLEDIHDIIAMFYDIEGNEMEFNLTQYPYEFIKQQETRNEDSSDGYDYLFVFKRTSDGKLFGYNYFSNSDSVEEDSLYSVELVTYQKYELC